MHWTDLLPSSALDQVSLSPRLVWTDIGWEVGEQKSMCRGCPLMADTSTAASVPSGAPRWDVVGKSD